MDGFFERAKRRLLAPLALCVLLPACGTVADFEQPIGDFKNAAGAIRPVLQEASARLQPTYDTIIRDRIMGDRPGWVVDRDGCAVTDTECVIVLRKYGATAAGATPEDDAGTTEITLPAGNPLANSLVLAAEIETYADNLLKIVQADTAEKVQEQVNATVASLGASADKAASLDRTEDSDGNEVTNPKAQAQADLFKEFLAPLEGLTTFFVGNYIDYVKRQGLRAATANSHALVQQAAAIFAVQVAGSVTVQAGDLREASFTSWTAYQEKRQELVGFDGTDAERTALEEDIADRLTAAIADAQAYNAYLSAAPSTVFDDFETAHFRMVERIQGRGSSLPEVIASIEAFASKIEALSAVLRQFQDTARQSQEASEG